VTACKTIDLALQGGGAHGAFTWGVLDRLQMGQAAGISPELLHRVTAVATGGLDALPHNGAVITLLAICKLTHKTSYFDIFVVGVLVPIASLVVLVTLGTLVGSF
jgi:H+/gluconate symporter-like permease